LNTSPQRLWALALAILFLVAHVAFLPPTLEDIDSLNFALGLHDFDPARHQPHPPGYPIFIALAKVVRLVIPSDAHALAVVSALFGALAVFALIWIYENLEALAARSAPAASLTASLATAVVVASPQYWFNAHRPMSDIPGLAAALAAQSALIAAFVRQRLNPARTPEALADSGKMIVLGAFLSALAIGMRSQGFWLTLPLLAVVLLQRTGRGAAGALLGSAMAFTIGVLVWAVPLVVASGGPAAYLRALGAQGGQDLEGVDMLYLNPTPRRLALNLLETFIYPWAYSSLGWTVFGLSFVGAIYLLRRAPRVALLMALWVGPYLASHLLLQETLTMRYALPLIPAMAYLVVRGIEATVAAVFVAIRRADVRPQALKHATTIATAAIVVWSLVVTLPPVRVYARDGAPAFAAIKTLHQQLAVEPGVIGMHHSLTRSVQTENFGQTSVLAAPPMREWLELTKYWRSGKTAPVWFLADPARTDIELVDPLSRQTQGRYVWGFERLRFMSGSRPDVVDLVRIDSPPGWFAEEGWHVSSETLNMSERLARKEAAAYVKRRADGALLIIGGQHWGAVESDAKATAAADVSLTINHHRIDSWQVRPGEQFFKRLILEPGTLSEGDPFNRVIVSYADPSGRASKIRLTEFAVAPLDAVFAVQHRGWNEVEYGKELQRRWRWTTARADTFVNSAGRDVTLTVSGESPLRYYESPARIVIRAGSQILATAAPGDDFDLRVKIPAAALAASDGVVTIETDKTFVPHERSGSPDRRTLGLRIFDFRVE
jgi:hypothetical protein